ncbi:MAG: hypothetical protein QOK05_2962 [Chloroflexota bacterium]|nr:hypothetical protein [Chloroflexota bacterium]
MGAFLVRPGEVVVNPIEGHRPSILRLVLLGPVMAILLQLRGALVLHGSAVAVDGAAAVFVGDTGAGKSTTAGALVRAGSRLLADDLVVVAGGGDRPHVEAGAPYLRLMPESLLALGEEPANLPRLRMDHEKRLQGRVAEFARTPMPLAAIYVLGVGPAVGIEAISAADGLAEVLRQAYCADLLPPSGLPAMFALCAAVAGAVPVRRLGRPQALGRLADVAAEVRSDLRPAP